MSVQGGRLIPAQLDDDPEVKTVLEIDFGLRCFFCVLKQSAVGWLSLGCVGTSAPFKDSFELRRVASPTWYDLVIWGGGMGCGGGYCASSFSVFHVARGRMYEVFQVQDSVNTFCFQKESKIGLPDDEPADPGIIVVRSKAAAKWPPPAFSKIRPETSCTVYRWRPNDFLFHPDRAAAEKRCGPPFRNR